MEVLFGVGLANKMPGIVAVVDKVTHVCGRLHRLCWCTYRNMKVVKLKDAGEPLTPEREDAAVKAAIGDATNCDKCKEPKTPLHGRMVWVGGAGMHLARICDGCLAEISAATEKKMAEIKARKDG